jgi:hypothetical protein
MPPMTFRCFRCEYPEYHEVPASHLVRCARCNLVQPTNVTLPFTAGDRPERTVADPIPRRWRAMRGRRAVETVVLLGSVAVAGGLAGFTTELVLARPRAGLIPQEPAASPAALAAPTAVPDSNDLEAEYMRIARRLRTGREPAASVGEPQPQATGSVPKPADGQSAPIPRAPESPSSAQPRRPAERAETTASPTPVPRPAGLPPGRPDLPQLPWTAQEASTLEREAPAADEPPLPQPAR